MDWNSRFIETRPTKKYCLGEADCDEQQIIKDAMTAGIADCDAVLTMRIGYDAQKRLKDQGILLSNLVALLKKA